MKRYFFSMLAIVLALSFSAFTARHSSTTTQKNWIFDDFGNESVKDDPSHYYLSGPTGEDDLPCEGGSLRCGVIANDNNGMPDLTASFTPVTSIEP